MIQRDNGLELGFKVWF